jgi:3-phenylpropionate/cinnamic acid dioxygenase small subunit
MAWCTSDEQQISNLIFRYAELVDAGRFDDVGALFEHSTYATRPGAEVAGMMKAFVIVYPDGTPKTRHVTTNVMIELDEAGTTAASRSSFTVHQAAPGLSLQVIVIGRYADRLEKVDGTWRFSERAITMDLIGDMSHHLRRPPPPTHLVP